MAFSIESRTPFLDYRIVEFGIALDGKYKIRNEWTKWIIRKSCRDYIPKEVALRKNKMGFPAPFSRWLRECNEKDEMKDIIYSFGERGIVPKDTIDYYYKQHINNNADRNVILYKFLVLELWLRTCNKFDLGS
jgi:asparagine synthase (glutamine-hydrolysing)